MTDTTPAVSVGPGQIVRFVVITRDGARASTWLAWNSKRHLDSYITCRPVGGNWKISLHESGSWQYGFTTLEKAREYHPHVLTRHMDIWPRPDEIIPGLRRAFTLVVPHSELRSFAVPNEPADLVRVPDPGSGYAAVIEFVLFSNNPPVRVDFPEPIFDIASLDRIDGTVLRIAARQAPWTPEQEEWLATQKKIFSVPAVAEVIKAKTPGSLRTMFMGYQNADGTRTIWDVAVE